MVGQSSTIFPAGHPSHEDVFRQLRKFLVAQPNLPGSDDYFTNVAGGHPGRRIGHKCRSIEFRYRHHATAVGDADDLTVHQSRMADKGSNERMSRMIVDRI